MIRAFIHQLLPFCDGKYQCTADHPTGVVPSCRSRSQTRLSSTRGSRFRSADSSVDERSTYWREKEISRVLRRRPDLLENGDEETMVTRTLPTRDAVATSSPVSGVSSRVDGRVPRSPRYSGVPSGRPLVFTRCCRRCRDNRLFVVVRAHRTCSLNEMRVASTNTATRGQVPRADTPSVGG